MIRSIIELFFKNPEPTPTIVLGVLHSLHSDRDCKYHFFLPLEEVGDQVRGILRMDESRPVEHSLTKSDFVKLCRVATPRSKMSYLEMVEARSEIKSFIS